MSKWKNSGFRIANHQVFINKMVDKISIFNNQLIMKGTIHTRNSFNQTHVQIYKNGIYGLKRTFHKKYEFQLNG